MFGQRHTLRPASLPITTPWSLPVERLLQASHTSATGLSSEQAQQRLTQYGPNVLKARHRFSAAWLLLNQIRSPLMLILLFAAVISAVVHEWVDATVIVVIVIGSALLSFAQEYSATSAVEKLRARVTAKATVLRDGKPCTILAESVVPGDVLLLSAGNLIAADGTLLEARDLYVNEAVLTGEPFPVEKKPGVVSEQAGVSERTNCVFMGTSVRSGIARALVTETGAHTVFGQVADRLTLRPPETEFERGIRHFGHLLTQIMLILVFVVFAANVFLQRPPIEALLFAIALAVGISPELLPAIISITLAKGARMMAARSVIVRRLSSIENFGSMDVLCTDKTGTLTEGVIRLDDTLDPSGHPSTHVLLYAYLNAHLQVGLENPLDDAIVAYGKQHGLESRDYVKIDEIPYDFMRKRLTVVVQEHDRAITLISKGALDNILEVCSTVQNGASTNTLDDATRERIEQLAGAWSDSGFRVLGIATRVVDPQAQWTRTDEHDLTFVGFLRFFDPPKPSIQDTLADLKALGVQLKIITGDNRRVTAHLAEQVGLRAHSRLTGAELNGLSDEALWQRAEDTDLFVEVDPNQKERIILALQKMGHVVGYMGDGINDAPALHAADVSISVEDATDVAKEAADLVLLEQDLDVLRAGIEEGRTTFANTIKYIFTTTSANFGNMLSMAGASLFLPFLPLLAKQVLLNNFLSDFPGMTIASDNVDREMVERPQRWDMGFIRSFMVTFGVISSAFDFLTFGGLLLIIQATPAQFRTGWFVESLMTELAITLVVRTRQRFFRSNPSRLLWLSTLLVAVLALALPYLPYSDVLGFTPLPLWVMALLMSITAAYIVASESAKGIFYARMLRGGGTMSRLHHARTWP